MDLKKEHESFLKEEEDKYKKLLIDKKKKGNIDTIIFPAHKEGFESVF